ncbi:MAG TPA: alpha/beta hydrolase [Candidatus Limnocylindrales bacterium]|nr:alpha/beta hydrolase [Candidatus Limnocylindrales bacterium]
MEIPVMEGLTATTITSPRISTRVLFRSGEGDAVLFLHGNASSATYWEEVMLALPPQYHAIAPDQRCYGNSDPAIKIDATRGMGDLADDAFALLDTLGIQKAHVVGHSLGGSVVWRMMMDHAERLLSVTQVSPGSPYGFSGTKGLDGELTFPDAAGTGAGTVNPTFPPQIAAGDRGDDTPVSPRVVMNAHIWRPPFKPAREEELLSSLLAMHIGSQDYPGDLVPSPNWPGFAPGVWGPMNGVSPLYRGDVSKIWTTPVKPPVLWVYGLDDTIVNDKSPYDYATYGILGLIPGYPGEEIAPQTLMLGQTRAVLEKYAAHGGQFREEPFAECGHSAYLEYPEKFNALFHEHLGA